MLWEHVSITIVYEDGSFFMLNLLILTQQRQGVLIVAYLKLWFIRRTGTHCLSQDALLFSSQNQATWGVGTDKNLQNVAAIYSYITRGTMCLFHIYAQHMEPVPLANFLINVYGPFTAQPWRT